MFVLAEEKDRTEEEKEIERKEKAKQRRSRTNFRWIRTNTQHPSPPEIKQTQMYNISQFGAAEQPGASVWPDPLPRRFHEGGAQREAGPKRGPGPGQPAVELQK